MTIHEALFSPLRQPLLGILYLLLTLQMALFLASFRDGRSARLRLFLLLHLLVSFVCLWLPYLDIDSNPFRTDAPIPLPAARSAFTLLPVWALFLYEAVTAFILAAAFRDCLRYRRDHPTFESVKETMDLLPAGIAFAGADGAAVFGNLTMNRLSRALCGQALTELSAFRSAVRERASGGENERQLTLPDGTVWQLTAQEVRVDGAGYTQLTATDITAQAAITRELQEKNKKLRDIRMRLDIYNRQAGRIIIAQELLTARMAVHNELGSILLEARHYLNDPAAIDEALLLQALQHTNTYLLREYEQDDTAVDPLSNALELAEAIGVRVEISGVPPTADAARELLSAAITECATNAVKHANGDALFVRLEKTESGQVFTLQSSGLPPTAEITESGGLLSLRALVEHNKGSMKLESLPQVKLTITLRESRES